MTGTPALVAAIVLGLSEGQFPRGAREGTVLCDADRRVLRRAKIDLDPDTQRRLLDENFLGYLAFTRASEQLILSRSVTDEAGRAARPARRTARARGRIVRYLPVAMVVVALLIGGPTMAPAGAADEDPNLARLMAPCYQALRAEEGRLTRIVEMKVALPAGRRTIDVRHEIPDSHRVRLA